METQIIVAVMISIILIMIRSRSFPSMGFQVRAFLWVVWNSSMDRELFKELIRTYQMLIRLLSWRMEMKFTMFLPMSLKQSWRHRYPKLNNYIRGKRQSAATTIFFEIWEDTLQIQCLLGLAANDSDPENDPVVVAMARRNQRNYRWRPWASWWDYSGHTLLFRFGK